MKRDFWLLLAGCMVVGGGAIGCEAPTGQKKGAGESVSSEKGPASAPKRGPAKAVATKKKAPAKTLPNARPYERKKATFTQDDTTWIFTPTAKGFDVADKSSTARFTVVQEKRTFQLHDTKTKKLKLAITWQPLGMAISHKKTGGAFLTMRLTPKGWVLHRPGKVEVGSYRGPLLRLGDRAATARADGRGRVHAKIAGRSEVVHTGGLAAREVVLTLLPELDLVEAATVALFFAEERW